MGGNQQTTHASDRAKALVEEHVSYSHAIAAELLSRFPPHIDRAELNSAAEWGLVQAANAFNAERGVSFTTFAYYRIRGAVFDLLRQSSRANRFHEAANEYLADYASGRSVAANAEAEYTEIRDVVGSVVTSYLLSLENLNQEPEDRSDRSPMSTLLREEQRQTILKALADLPEKNRTVLQLYYFEELGLEEIGKKLGLSKSWVSRIHAKSLEMLRPTIQRMNAPRSSGVSR